MFQATLAAPPSRSSVLETRTTGTGAVRIATLEHEAGDGAMEADLVVVTGLGQVLQVLSTDPGSVADFQAFFDNSSRAHIPITTRR